MKDKVFLDTNILVYLANEDSSFHAVVKDKLKIWQQRVNYGFQGRF